MLTELLIFGVVCLILLYIWNDVNFSYWKRRNLKYLKPLPLLGNFKDVVSAKKAIFQQIESIYNSTKEPLIGIYLLQRPAIMIRDLELIKQIMIKDFNQFADRVLSSDPEYDPLGGHNLFLSRNPKWHELRKRLSPVYTSGKLKQMYPLMLEIAKDMENVLHKIPHNSCTDVKSIAIRFTTDLVGSIAFGLKANSLNDLNSEFYINNLKVFEVTISRGLQFSLFYILPALAARLRLKVFSAPATKFIRRTVEFALHERLRTGHKRNDLIDALIEIKRDAEKDADSPPMDLDFLAAQAGIFQIAGFETSSSTTSFALYELALQPQIQDRLRQEIVEAFGDEDAISCEKLQELPYLTQVVNETLRKYPILAHLERTCTPVKGSNSYSMKPYWDFEVPAGMPIFVSPLAIHNDEQYWPEPHKFDPERFAPENRGKINWNAYMPFGTGQRNCIGMRLGLLQSKLGIVHFLRQHRVSPCEKTPKKVEFESRSPLLCMKGSVILNVEKIA